MSKITIGGMRLAAREKAKRIPVKVFRYGTAASGAGCGNSI
jgi:hypothetical protein